MKTVVAFQGGGALGAFGAGAWSALSSTLATGDLVGLVGLPIGALNAACVARHFAEPGGGAAALTDVWSRLQTPSWPFLPPSVGGIGLPFADAWNGLTTGMLMGTRNMSRAALPAWLPPADMVRLNQPLHDRSAMWRLLSEIAGHDSRDGGPLLAVGAVDVLAGSSELFHSDDGPVSTEHLAASTAIPFLFDPVEIDGRTYWDGEVIRESYLAPFLARLLSSGRIKPGEPLQLVTIEVLPRAIAKLPESGPEIMFCMMLLLQQGKLNLPTVDGVNIARHLRIQRQATADDGISGQFDFSPRRIKQLVAEGRQAADTLLTSGAAIDG